MYYLDMNTFNLHETYNIYIIDNIYSNLYI